MDDPTEDFNRVTTSIKEDISSLNNKLSEIEVMGQARGPSELQRRRVLDVFPGVILPNHERNHSGSSPPPDRRGCTTAGARGDKPLRIPCQSLAH